MESVVRCGECVVLCCGERVVLWRVRCFLESVLFCGECGVLWSVVFSVVEKGEGKQKATVYCIVYKSHPHTYTRTHNTHIDEALSIMV